jgi:hypothetical protein
LAEIGYQRVVFLRAVPGMRINGLAIMEDEVELSHAPQPERLPLVIPIGQPLLARPTT